MTTRPPRLEITHTLTLDGQVFTLLKLDEHASGCQVYALHRGAGPFDRDTQVCRLYGWRVLRAGQARWRCAVAPNRADGADGVYLSNVAAAKAEAGAWLARQVQQEVTAK